MTLLPSRRRRGGNAIEFALLAPVYLTVAFAMIEYGVYFSQEVMLDNVARACARAAAYADDADMETAGETAAIDMVNAYSNALHFDYAGLTYTFTRDASGAAPLATCTFELEEDYESISGFPLVFLPQSLSAEATFRSEVWDG